MSAAGFVVISVYAALAVALYVVIAGITLAFCIRFENARGQYGAFIERARDADVFGWMLSIAWPLGIPIAALMYVVGRPIRALFIAALDTGKP